METNESLALEWMVETLLYGDTIAISLALVWTDNLPKTVHKGE